MIANTGKKHRSKRGAAYQKKQTRYNSSSKPTQNKAAKNYWARRTRLIAAARKNSCTAMLQKKMALNSDVPLLDVKLLTKKAEQRQKRKQKMLTHLHLNLVTKVTYCLEQLPVDCSPTEDELVSAFNGLKVHTSTSEPYFWEHCYNIYPATQPIAVDSGGKAHIFKPVSVQTKSSSETISTNREQMQRLMQSANRNVTLSCVSYHQTPYRL